MTHAIDSRAWLVAPHSLPLPVGELHLWQVHARPDCPHSPQARTALRNILGRYMSLTPRDLQLAIAPGGKPMLDPTAHPNAPRFNLSHSGDIILIAVACGNDVGVDVEVIRNDLDVLELAQRFFAPREIDELRKLPEADRVRAFFTGWTRKEAYLKARGEGIASGLAQFAVTLSPGVPARLLSDARYPTEVASWRVEDIPLGPSYAAAVAVRGNLRTRYCKIL